MKRLGKPVVMLFLFCTIFSSELAGQLSSDARDRVFHSTVSIYAEKRIYFETDEGVYDSTFTWGGSGNVLSQDGWILTNAHVAFFNPLAIDPSFAEYDLPYEWYEPDFFVIYYNSNSELPPQELCYGYVREGYYFYHNPDMALIKCTSYLDGSIIPEDEEIFPECHRLGDSDDLDYGDEVYCVGYPDYSYRSISYTSGEITNLVSDVDEFGETVRYLLGTDADISSGNSGGAAVDRAGKLIGLPTSVQGGGVGGGRSYITPINRANWLLGKYVEEAELGASLEGRIVSAQTGEGIIGAELFILWPGVNVAEFMALVQKNPRTDEDNYWLNYSIFANCVSVIDGRFSLDHLLPSGYEYSIIVFANNYENNTAQDYLNINNSNDRNITLEMVRQ